MKKILFVFISVFMILSMITPTYAQESYNNYPTCGLYKPEVYVSDYEMPDVMLLGENEYTEDELLFEVEQLVKDALLKGERTVYLTSYNAKMAEHYWILYLKCFSPYFSNGINLAA